MLHLSPLSCSLARPLARLVMGVSLAALPLSVTPSAPGALSASLAKPASKKALKRLDADAPMSAHSLPALSDEARALLSAVRPDPEPESLVRNSHYWVSNEHNHQVWLEPLKAVSGGAYVGVGTDQNYLLAGWSKPEVMILMDFDGEIAKLHEIYEYFFAISASPKTFHLRWKRAYAEDSKEKLAAYFTARFERLQPNLSDKQRAKLVKQRVKIYQLTRGLIDRRLARTHKKYQALKQPTFLSDQAQYDHLRALWAQGRVLAIRGDLTADQTMLDIAHTLKAMSLSLNTLYLSNAEQYFELTPGYRRNIIELPWGERGVALRTLGWRVWGFLDEEEKYHYNYQGGANFRAWMERGRYKKPGQMLRQRTKTEPFGTSTLDAPPVEGKTPPKIAPVPAR
jgi:hypothetical protein